MNAHGTKRCAKCWRYLPLDDFGHDGTTSDNLTYRCNDCRTIMQKADQNDIRNAYVPGYRNDRAETITTANHFHPDR